MRGSIGITAHAFGSRPSFKDRAGNVSSTLLYWQGIQPLGSRDWRFLAGGVGGVQRHSSTAYKLQQPMPWLQAHRKAVVHQQHGLNKGAAYCPKWCGRRVAEPPRQPLRLAVRGGREGCTTGYHKARLAGIQLYLQHAPPPLTHAGAPHACRHTVDTVQTPG